MREAWQSNEREGGYLQQGEFASDAGRYPAERAQGSGDVAPPDCLGLKLFVQLVLVLLSPTGKQISARPTNNPNRTLREQQVVTGEPKCGGTLQLEPCHGIVWQQELQLASWLRLSQRPWVPLETSGRT